MERTRAGEKSKAKGTAKRQPAAKKQSLKDMNAKDKDKVSGGYAIPIPNPRGPDNEAPYIGHAYPRPRR